MPVLPLVAWTMAPPAPQPAAALGVVDHRDGDAVLHAAARVARLQLGDEAGAQAGPDARQLTAGVRPIVASIPAGRVDGLGFGCFMPGVGTGRHGPVPAPILAGC